MHLPSPAANFESRDVALFEFNDSELKMDHSRPVRDETIRRVLSERFCHEIKPAPAGASLDRLLILAREREQFCRGANDSFGLARSLGNQALIERGRGRFQEAFALLGQLEALSRRQDDAEGLTFALVYQAAILNGELNQASAALPLAMEANRLAAENRLFSLAQYIEPIVKQIRARC